jgi:hypothetical protein
VGVGADEGVGIGLGHAVDLAGPDAAAQVLEVHLVADAGGWRHDPEVVERGLAPAQERVALAVPLVVALGVHVEGALVPEGVDLDGVVDDQVDVDERVDRARVPAEFLHRVAHRGQVDDRGNPGEVLHQNPRRLERDLDRRLGLCIPAGDRLDVARSDRGPVLEAQRVLEQDLERVGQARDVEAPLQGVEPVDLELAATDFQARLRSEAVLRAHVLSLFPALRRPDAL